MGIVGQELPLPCALREDLFCKLSCVRVTPSQPRASWGRLLDVAPCNTVGIGKSGQRVFEYLRASARGQRREVSATSQFDRGGKVLVQVVDVFDSAAGQTAGDGDVVEHRQVLDGLAQSDTAAWGQTGTPNVAASNKMAMFSFTPATRLASICRTESAPACSICLKITRLATCSPVATGRGWI
jgi:hypothetical protein